MLLEQNVTQLNYIKVVIIMQQAKAAHERQFLICNGITNIWNQLPLKDVQLNCASILRCCLSKDVHTSHYSLAFLAL
jgi:hypothetical protein